MLVHVCEHKDMRIRDASWMKCEYREVRIRAKSWMIYAYAIFI